MAPDRSPGLVRVAVDAPLLTPLTYAVPLDQSAPAGARVLVPLGRRRAAGVVLGVAEGPAPEGIKPLIAVLDDQPAIPADVLGMAEFAAAYYRASPGELLKAALPHMLQQGSGSLVLTSSDAAVVGEAERPAYAASKAGVNALCRHVSTRWGREGIRCNAVSPGFVLTEQLDANMPQEMKDWMLKGARSTRHGQSDDIAGAVAFLLSDDSEWVNGQIWRVNGGVSYAN